MNSQIIISNVAIRQDDNGLYSLNDLHVASGKVEKHQPAFFMRRAETTDLIDEISNSANLQNYIPALSKSGRYGGTYVCKELVYAYAMWISAAFSLKVIRAYDALVAERTVSNCNSASASAGLSGNLLTCFLDGQVVSSKMFSPRTLICEPSQVASYINTPLFSAQELTDIATAAVSRLNQMAARQKH